MPPFRLGFWSAHAAVNIAVGAVAGAAWPFVVLMNFVLAIKAGWAIDDPTVTEDGWYLPVGMGVAVIVVVGALFAAANVLLARRGRVPARRWLPPALVVGVLTAVVVVRLA